MKARLLKKILDSVAENGTSIRYDITNHGEYIAIGSSLCHDLISVNKETFKVKYALDFNREGRVALDRDRDIRPSELLLIWDKLHELIETGEINDIMHGRDKIENPLPVFTVEDGKLCESVTDIYGWPNLDDNGMRMHDNTHFQTKEQAIQYGIKENKYYLVRINEMIQEIEEKLVEAKGKLKKHQDYISHLKTIK